MDKRKQFESMLDSFLFKHDLATIDKNEDEVKFQSESFTNEVMELFSNEEPAKEEGVIKENPVISEDDITEKIKCSVINFMDRLSLIKKEDRKTILDAIDKDVYSFFDGCHILHKATKEAVKKCNIINMNYHEMWTSIALNNAKVSNSPEEVATRAVKEYKKQFKLE